MPVSKGPKGFAQEMLSSVDGKACSRCKTIKPGREFSRSRIHKTGLRPECKVCAKIGQRRYYERNRDTITAKSRAYNATEHRKAYSRDYQRQYSRMVAESRAPYPRPETCECCGQRCKKALAYDHNHGTGEFRGWLCNRCNRTLGMCEDSIAVLQSLTAYLFKRGSYGESRKVRKSHA